MSDKFEDGYTEIWDKNFGFEVHNLLWIYKDYPIVAVDTEFPGSPCGDDKKWSLKGRAQDAYEIIKRNVDSTKLITLGLY